MRRILIFFGLAMAFSASVAQAAAIKNSEFMKLSAGQRHWFYYGAYSSIGHMVSFKDEKKAQCVWLWMTKELEKKKKLLETNFKKFPNHTPTSIILALVKRDCGVVFPKINK